LSRGLAPTDNNPPRKPAQKLGEKLPTPPAAQKKKKKPTSKESCRLPCLV
jgi:hypothetical protein